MTNAKTLEREKIVAEIVSRFRTFGGGKVNPDNPISVALKDSPPQFAAGVDVGEVVDAIQSLRASVTGEGHPELERWLCGDQVNCGFIRDICFTVWKLCHEPTHADGNTDWGTDTLPTVNAGVERIRERLAALRASGGRGLSSSGLSGNTGINDPAVRVEEYVARGLGNGVLGICYARCGNEKYPPEEGGYFYCTVRPRRDGDAFVCAHNQ